jgi:hypothetical protein
MRRKLCGHCNEEITGASLNFGIALFHIECGIRMVSGSVGHQQGRCSCYGETDRSEIGISKREAAIAAWKLFNRKN